MFSHLFCLICMVGSSGALRRGLEISGDEQLGMHMTGADPRNYRCNLHRADVNAKNLKDFAEFFESGMGKRISLGGDSLMSQLYQVLYCAGAVLGYYPQEKGFKRVWRRQGSAPNNTGFLMSNDVFFYTIDDLNKLMTPEMHTRKLDQLFPPQYDLHILNLGHYVYKDPTTFAKLAPVLFAGLKFQALATESHVVLVDHPPQHFNTDTGAYITPGDIGDEYWKPGYNKSRVHDCSCKQPHMDQQHAKINNNLAASLAREHGFDYVTLWDDMNRCDEHPYDCTHIQLSPGNFNGVIRGLSKIMAR